jgi:hypothetical protein
MSQHGFQIVLDNLDSPAKLVYGFIIVIAIVYSSAIPSEYRQFADSLLGRVFGIAIIYSVTHFMGWVYGLLTAMAFLLILNGVSRSEGFYGTIDSEKSDKNVTWLVDEILEQKTKKTDTIKVTTEAVH